MSDIQIKDNPTLKSYIRTLTEIGITGIIWGIWIYLLLPIINLLLWVFGIKHIYVEVFENLGYKEFLTLIQKMGWIIIGFFVVLRLWGYYNYWRFAKRNKRKSVKTSNVEDITKIFNIETDKIKKLMYRKEIVWPPEQ